MQDKNSIEIFFPKKQNPVLIDLVDLSIFYSRSWSLSSGYLSNHESEKVKTLFQNLILGAKKFQFVDHKNRNKFDYRRKNLRLCSFSQNNINRDCKKKKTSKYRGVSFIKRDNLWSANISYEGINYHLGRFKNEKDAAIAYNKKAIEIHKEFAQLNIFV